jgi:DNA-binding NarL/FixJ family response regulator
MSQFKKLTEDDLLVIKKLYKKGFTMNAIAKQLDVTKTTVKYHLMKMRIKLRSRNDYFQAG